MVAVTPVSSIVNWKENFSGKQKMKWKSNASKRNQVLPRKQVNQEEAIRKVKDSATTDPKSYVDTILDIHRKYHALVTQAFDNDSGFATSLDRAASNFVNS